MNRCPLNPADTLPACSDITPRLQDRLPVDNVSQKEIAVAIRAAAQRGAVVYYLVRLDEGGVQLWDVGLSPR